MKVSRIFELPYYQLEHFPQNDSLAAKENGSWTKYSTQDFIDNATNISYGLLSLGINKDDKVAIISNNRPEWNFVDIGILQIGAINVPIYPTISESDYKFILNDAEVKIVFVSDEDLYQKIQNIKADVPNIQEVYTFNEVNDAKNWKEVLEAGKSYDNKDSLIALKDSVTPEDLATLIYTSGTTGTPKGVMLTHNNLVSNFSAIDPLPHAEPGDKALSFLPLCHVYERALTYMYMMGGIRIYYAETMESIGENLKEVKPTIFTSVPRLLEKVYDKIVAKGSELTGIKKKLFFWALNLGLRYDHFGKNGWWYEFQLSIANKIIFNKWREALGGNVQNIVSGGAALQVRLARVFWAAQIPVLEGYGLTETSPVIAVSNFKPAGRKFGTVGPVLEGIEVKIAEDGEILCKGPNVMKGYYKRDDLTKEVIDEDGWFHTGDIGVLEDGKYLKITDRKKEIFKTSGGKYIAPLPLESKFKESLFIEQIMVVGEGQKFAAALIYPSFDNLKNWCEKNGVSYSSNEEVIKDEKVLSQFDSELEIYNAEFGNWETIKKFELVSDEWTPESGLLTPTLKLKRKVIMEKYKDLVDNIYSN